ncbi:MAG: ATPase, partial [Verrucomicrobiota bacterium]
LPEEDTLRALFDRFLLRVRCDAVPDALLGEVLRAGWELEQREELDPAEVTADEVRAFQGGIRQVDLAPIREPYLALVRKLRAAGVEVSDRRAVRLQRIVAASALVSGRVEARVSDFWIFRHIWDREEQVEIIESMVGAALEQSEPEERDHPQAFQTAPPDPETLHQGVLSIEARLAENRGDPAAADDLRQLSNRIEWVPSGVARETLEEKRDELWGRINGA